MATTKATTPRTTRPRTTAADPAAPETESQPDIAALQAQIAELQRQQKLAERRAQATAELLPSNPADPDIMGLPGIKPLRLVSPDEDEDEPAARHPLFYIDDKPVTVPDYVPANVMIEYLYRAAPGTEAAYNAANNYLLSQVLGEEGFARLRAYKRLTLEQLGWVTEMCTRIALGSVETPKES